MNFLGGVVAFLSMVYLTWYVFTVLENNLLGIASLGAIGLAFLMMILSVKMDR